MVISAQQLLKMAVTGLIEMMLFSTPAGFTKAEVVNALHSRPKIVLDLLGLLLQSVQVLRSHPDKKLCYLPDTMVAGCHRVFCS